MNGSNLDDSYQYDGFASNDRAVCWPRSGPLPSSSASIREAISARNSFLAQGKKGLSCWGALQPSDSASTKAAAGSR